MSGRWRRVGELQVTSDGMQNLQVSWLADGCEIAFESEGAYSLSPLDQLPSGAATIWAVDAQGGTPRQVTRQYNPQGAHSNPM